MAGFMVFGALILSICVLVLVVLKMGKLHGQEYPSGGRVLRRTRTFQSCSAGARRQAAIRGCAHFLRTSFFAVQSTLFDCVFFQNRSSVIINVEKNLLTDYLRTKNKLT
jgi:hypothetical protein